MSQGHITDRAGPGMPASRRYRPVMYRPIHSLTLPCAAGTQAWRDLPGNR